MRVDEQPLYVLTEREVAQRFRVTPRTVQEWRRRHVGPPYFKCGRLVRYSLFDLEAYIESNTRRNGLERLASGTADLRGRLG